ncbi:MAG: tetratricopeptide repeat protein [Planctomycetota bacterium]
MTEPQKPPLSERVLNRIPIFGRMRRLRGWVRRHKGWVYLGIAVVVIFIVRPALMIVAALVSALRPVLTAIFDNPVGRFVFYNVLAILLLYWVWRKVRAGVLRVLGLRCMRAFLDGMTLMIHSRWQAALRQFEKVVWWGRWINLEDAVPEHRDIRADARIKIATCHLRLGRFNEAKSWLLRVREKEMLTDHVRRNHAELRALAYDSSDELEQETIVKELERTQSRDRSNRRVLAALRDRAEATGDLERTRSVGRLLVAASEGREKEEAERDLALVEFRLAHQALGEGDRKRMRRALKATAGDTRSALMLGDLALEEGDVRGALKAWSRAVSLPVFDRLARLLESGRLAGDREKDLLLRHFPYAGTLLVLAEHYRKRREYRKARAALEKVLASAGENITVLRLYASCLEGEGDTARAAELYRRALSASFG